MAADATALEHTLRTAVDAAFESDQVPWLRRLVDQPSCTTARDDVEAAATIIDEATAELGMRRTLHPDPDGVFADHRAHALPGVADDTRALALVGHCDTVFPRSQGFLEFRRDADDGPSGGDHIFGPGVLDMKSGLSVIVFGLRAVARCAPEIFAALPVRFLCNCDEEIGSTSSRAMFEAMAPVTSAGIVFESGRLGDRIITGRKGTGGFTLTVHGHESHAGNFHEEGVNAIHALSLLIPRIEALTDYERGTTLNVGVIAGGTVKNTVPGSAHCVVDARVTTMAEARRVEAALAALTDDPLAGVPDVPDRVRGVRVELEGGLRRLPMEPTAASQALRCDYEPFAAAEGIGVGEAPLQGGGSDANLLAACGVPCIDGLGPWGEHLHSVREWSSLDSLRRRTRSLACFLVSGAAIRS